MSHVTVDGNSCSSKPLRRRANSLSISVLLPVGSSFSDDLEAFDRRFFSFRRPALSKSASARRQPIDARKPKFDGILNNWNKNSDVNVVENHITFTGSKDFEKRPT
jgi:hypothetical protein